MFYKLGFFPFRVLFFPWNPVLDWTAIDSYLLLYNFRSMEFRKLDIFNTCHPDYRCYISSWTSQYPDISFQFEALYPGVLSG